MALPNFSAAEEETAKRFAQVRKLFAAFLVNWKTTLLAVFLLAGCWKERFWRDPVMPFTCPNDSPFAWSYLFGSEPVWVSEPSSAPGECAPNRLGKNECRAVRRTAA